MTCKKVKKSLDLVGSGLPNREANYIHKEIHPKNMTGKVDGQW